MKDKPCRICEATFTPTKPLQRVCGTKCAIAYNRKVDAEKAEKEKAESDKKRRKKSNKYRKTISKVSQIKNGKTV